MSLVKSPLLLRLKSFLRNRAPKILVLGSRVASRTVFYKKERAYLRGARVSGGQEASVLLFAPERCATQYTNTLVTQLYEEVDGHCVILPNYFFHASPKRTSLLSDRDWLAKNLEPKGYFYGSIGMLRTGGELDLNPYKVLATVRDPRDILVSAFYSVAYAHTPSNKQFFLDAKEAREKGIDWFVTQEWRIKSIRDKIRFIYDEVRPLENSMVWRYEDMMSDFEPFIRGLAGHIAPQGKLESVVSAMVAEKTAQQKERDEQRGENVLQHMRSGKSKQYLEKLQPDTVTFLTDYFRQELQDFDYDHG